jgi:hypothetical protein
MGPAMALFILSRFCLIVLLGCDYVWDPFDGTNPSSHPLGSTEAYCHSLKACEAICSNVAEKHTQPGYGLPADGVTCPTLPPVQVQWTIAVTDTADRLYLYMSLQC